MTDKKKTGAAAEEKEKKTAAAHKEEPKKEEAKETKKGDAVSAEEKAFEDKLKVLMDQYVRLQADFDNYRRRTREEAARTSETVTAEVLTAFLPVLDNFDLALAHMKKDKAGESYVKGFDMVARQMKKIMEGYGVKELDALHQPFNPHFHEAVMQTTSDELDDDTVSMVLQKGYMMKDKVLRPAKVQVSHKS